MGRNDLTWLFFGFSGRISRMAFFLAGLLWAVFQAFALYRFTVAEQAGGATNIWAMLFWALFFLSVWSSVALGVKRLHDFGKPGIFTVALFIPMVSIIAFIALCFWPGDEGANRYGTRTNAPA